MDAGTRNIEADRVVSSKRPRVLGDDVRPTEVVLSVESLDGFAERDNSVAGRQTVSFSRYDEGGQQISAFESFYRRPIGVAPPVMAPRSQLDTAIRLTNLVFG